MCDLADGDKFNLKLDYLLGAKSEYDLAFCVISRCQKHSNNYLFPWEVFKFYPGDKN